MIAPHLAEIDYREPILTFSLPVDGDNTVYGIFWISNLYWIEVLLLVCLNVLLATVTGAVVYKVIIEPGKTDTPIAKILGFGALLPFWITWPTTIFQLLDVRNLLFKFILGGVTPTITLFRVLEAIYGCCPPHATKSFQDFVVYFGSVLVFTRDEKTGDYVKASAPMKLMCLRKFVILLLITGLFQSILSPFPSMNVFGDPIGSNEWFTFARMTTWQLYANSLFHAGMCFLNKVTLCSRAPDSMSICISYCHSSLPVVFDDLL